MKVIANLVMAALTMAITPVSAASLQELVKTPEQYAALSNTDQLNLSEKLNTTPLKFEKAIYEYNNQLAGEAENVLNGGTYNTKLQLDKYTVTLTCIFLLQMAFCFGIFGYVSNKVKAAELRNEKQKAWFYSFLYQYHK